MVMVASQCLSSRRRSWYIFTSSWSTCASPSRFPRGSASRDISKGSSIDRGAVPSWKLGSSLGERNRLARRSTERAARSLSRVSQLSLFAISPRWILFFDSRSFDVHFSSLLNLWPKVSGDLPNVDRRRFLRVTGACSRDRRWKSYDDPRQGGNARKKRPPSGTRFRRSTQSPFLAVVKKKKKKRKKIARFTNRSPRTNTRPSLVPPIESRDRSLPFELRAVSTVFQRTTNSAKSLDKSDYERVWKIRFGWGLNKLFVTVEAPFRGIVIRNSYIVATN